MSQRLERSDFSFCIIEEGGEIMDKKKTVVGVCIGIATAAAVLVVAALLRSLIRNVTFAEAFQTPYLWFASAVGGIGTATAFLKKGQKK